MTDDIVERLWRMADMTSADNDLSDITTAANYIVELRAEIQQLTADCIEELREEIQELKKKTNSVYNDWSDAICENSDLREKNAELRDEIERLRERGDDWSAAMTENHDLWRENERLRAALLKISELEPEGPLGNDCMAVSYASETARAALEGD